MCDGERKDALHSSPPLAAGTRGSLRGGVLLLCAWWGVQIWWGACTLGLCRCCCSRCPCLTLAALRSSHLSTDSGSLGGSPLCLLMPSVSPSCPVSPRCPVCLSSRCAAQAGLAPWEPSEVRVYPLVALAAPTLQVEVYLEAHTLSHTRD